MLNVLNRITDDVKKRFFDKVIIIDNGCHLWTGAKSTKRGKSYGYFAIKCKTITAYRLSWILANNKEIPDGIYICHHCDNSLCVNPEHLFLGTQQDNVTDMVNKNRYGKSAKITKEHVKEIYVLYDRGLSLKEISKYFPISEGNIFKILSGIRWKKTFNKEHRKYSKVVRLTNIQLLQICSLLKQGIKNVDIAKMFNVGDSLISSIKNGGKHKNLYFNYCKEIDNE